MLYAMRRRWRAEAVWAQQDAVSIRWKGWRGWI